KAGFARCTPTALARDDLVAAGVARTHEQWLDDPLPAHRLREPGTCFAVEALARLPRVRVHRVDRQLEQLVRGDFHAADEHLEAAAEAPPVRRARQAPSPPSSTRPLRASGGRTRSQGARGSAPPRDARS